jgi:hypothetical protein
LGKINTALNRSLLFPLNCTPFFEVVKKAWVMDLALEVIFDSSCRASIVIFEKK